MGKIIKTVLQLFIISLFMMITTLPVQANEDNAFAASYQNICSDGQMVSFVSLTQNPSNPGSIAAVQVASREITLKKSNFIAQEGEGECAVACLGARSVCEADVIVSCEEDKICRKAGLQRCSKNYDFCLDGCKRAV